MSPLLTLMVMGEVPSAVMNDPPLGSKVTVQVSSASAVAESRLNTTMNIMMNSAIIDRRLTRFVVLFTDPFLLIFWLFFGPPAAAGGTKSPQVKLYYVWELITIKIFNMQKKYSC